MSPTPALVLLPLLLPTVARAGTHPPGTLLEDAAVADLTPEGLDALADVLPSLLPARIDLEPMSGEDWYYSYSLTDAWVGITVQDANLEPTPGVLVLQVDLLIQLNDASDPFYLDYEAGWIFSGTCEGHVVPFPASVDASLALQVVTGPDGLPVLDATVTSITPSYDLQSDDIVLEDCSISSLETVLNWFGLSIYDLVLSYADSYIQEAIAGSTADIEAMIEDAFASATIEQDLDLGGASVHLLLYPSDVAIDTAGVRVALDGSLEANAASACVQAWDPGGSPATASQPPALGTVPAGVTAGYHVGILASDDLLNQGLYALWQGGVLCYTIDASFESFPVNTSILTMLDGGEEGPFTELFPENAPLEIVTRPRVQPLASFTGDHAVDVVVDDLGLDFYAEVDHRMALALGLDLDATAGIDLALDPASGTLSIPVDLSPSNVVTTVRAAELTPGADAAIQENFAGLLETILQTVLGSMLEDLAYALPAYEGIGLTDLETAAAGAAEDWLGLFARVGPVSYAGEGCGEDGGCESGCAGVTGPRGAARLALLGFVWLLLALRRRA